jgi:hypothetical protein
MYKHHTINSSRFTVRFCTVANYLNFKKVGSFEKLLRQMNPEHRLKIHMGSESVARLIKELDEYIKENED